VALLLSIVGGAHPLRHCASRGDSARPRARAGLRAPVWHVAALRTNP